MQKVVVDMSDTKKKSRDQRARARKGRARETRRQGDSAPPKATPESLSADWAKFGESVAAIVGATTAQPQRMESSLREAMQRVAWARTAPISQADTDFLRKHAGLDDPSILDEWTAEKEDERRAEVAMASAIQLVADTMSRDDASAAIGIDVTNVSRRARNGQLYAVYRDSRPRFPRWQFRDGQPLPGLAPIVACLEKLDLDPVSVGTFMVRPNDELEGVRPVDYLAADGAPESVVALLDAWARS